MRDHAKRLGTVCVAFSMALLACRGTSDPVSAAGGGGQEDVRVTVSPASAEVYRSDTVAFDAVVTGTANTNVLWSVQESGGGIVDASGLYSAPSADGTYHVVVSSAAAPAISATAVVTVTATPTASPPSISPASGTWSPPVNVTITCPNGGALPYRTTDGSAPTTSAPQSATATFTSSGQVRAVCAGPNYTTSAEATATYTVTNVLPLDRVTVWKPGVPGGVPNTAGWTVHATLSPGATVSQINAALSAAGAVATAQSPRVVQLAAGTFSLSGTIFLSDSHVVLRGAGPGSTRLRFSTGGAQAITIEGGGGWGSLKDVSGSPRKGDTTITLSNVTGLAVGDVIQIDQRDDPSYVFLFDAIYSKRAPGWNNSGPVSPGVTGHSGYRSVNEMHEISAISGNTVTLSTPLRMNYDAAFGPQAWEVISGPTSRTLGLRFAGLEDVYVTGGRNDNIRLEQAAYSWIKNVESDGTTTTGLGMSGRHIAVSHCFRCEVRQAYVHHATEIVNGGGAYGIHLLAATSESLVEDSIAVYLNKGMQTDVSGGGNVFGYNYVDNVTANAASLTWMDGACNGSHQAFSHSDLWEGNWCANMGSDMTHGSSGFLTYFRNFAAGRVSDPSWRSLMTDNLRAFNVDAWGREMTAVGNVMMANPVTFGGTNYQPVYEISSHLVDSQPATIWRLGEMDMRGGGGVFDTQYATPGPNDGGVLPTATYTTRAKEKLWRHGNWDSVTGTVSDWQASYSTALPDSLYLSAKPAFFGASPWPWIDPTGATAADRVKALPAKARFDAGTPNG